MMTANSFKTRWEFIEPYCKGKSVLDIGPAELTGTVNKEKLERAVWPRIVSVAKKVIGLERSPEQVHTLRELGYDIRQGDAQNFDLGETFEMIMAGELIEHLSNPGLFLECVKRHLEPGGVLVLTTPNRFSATDYFSYFRRNLIPTYDKPIAKHVAYYDENCLLDLLSRHGFKNFSIGYYEMVGQPPQHLTTKIMLAWLRKWRVRFLPGLMVSARL
jgi:SAM-dependent methyltransferase